MCRLGAYLELTACRCANIAMLFPRVRNRRGQLTTSSVKDFPASMAWMSWSTDECSPEAKPALGGTYAAPRKRARSSSSRLELSTSSASHSTCSACHGRRRGRGMSRPVLSPAVPSWHQLVLRVEPSWQLLINASSDRQRATGCWAAEPSSKLQRNAIRNPRSVQSSWRCDLVFPRDVSLRVQVQGTRT